MRLLYELEYEASGNASGCRKDKIREITAAEDKPVVLTKLHEAINKLASNDNKKNLLWKAWPCKRSVIINRASEKNTQSRSSNEYHGN